MKYIFKSLLYAKSGFVAREFEYVVDRYDISNWNARYVKG
jgi:hypothetical protein